MIGYNILEEYFTTYKI